MTLPRGGETALRAALLSQAGTGAEGRLQHPQASRSVIDVTAIIGAVVSVSVAAVCAAVAPTGAVVTTGAAIVPHVCGEATSSSGEGAVMYGNNICHGNTLE